MGGGRDGRKNHRGRAQVPSGAVPVPEPEPEPQDVAPEPSEDGVVETTLGDSPVVIREKVHLAQPMTIDDALYEMELVGHDFFLFVDAETAQPSVAYRRRGWSYGVIKLDAAVTTTGSGTAPAGAVAQR